MSDDHASDIKPQPLERKQEFVVMQPADNPSRRSRGRSPEPTPKRTPNKIGRYARTDEDRRLLRELGDRLRWAREELELTLNQAADLVGVDRSTWYNYERGKRFPDLVRIPDICARLNVDTEYLLRGSLLGVEKSLAIRLAFRHPELEAAFRTASDKSNKG